MPDPSQSGGLWQFYLLEVAYLLLALPVTFAKILQQPTASVWWHALRQRLRRKQGECLRHSRRIRWKIELPDTLSRDRSYLLLANQQGSRDSLLISAVLSEKITPIVSPLRHSRLPNLFEEWFAWLEEAPVYIHISAERQTNDPQYQQVQLQQVGAKYRNILDQTRSLLLFPEKDAYRGGQPHFRHSDILYIPKPGELIHATLMQSLGWHSVLDITLYQEKPVRFSWQWWWGTEQTVVMVVRELEFPAALQASSANDIRKWLLALWQEKARFLENILQQNDDTLSTSEIMRSHES